LLPSSQQILTVLNKESDAVHYEIIKCKKDIAIPVTGRGSPYGCERSMLPHFLDNRLTDGGVVVSLTHQPPFTRQEDSWYSFLLEAESN
jgi:hypothetical protein